MSMLAEHAEVVIGVDTHRDTHTAAVLDSRTGAVLARTTVTAGLARHLAQAGEWVIELDRPKRPARRAGAKSDPIDAERAARDALGRTQLTQPKTGAQRAALQLRMTARDAAVQAATDAQRQLHAMVITAPEPVRAKFRGQGRPRLACGLHRPDGRP